VQDFKEIEKNIETIRAEKEAAIKAQDYEKAAALRDSEQHTKEKLERILNGWREHRDGARSRYEESPLRWEYPIVLKSGCFQRSVRSQRGVVF
jgi:ATP-dependent Clp protease ATP-binding subunit ClpA